MNPRILKKLSKRADPYIKTLTTLHRFVTEKYDHIDCNQKIERKWLTRINGNTNQFNMFNTYGGTIGYGEMHGYYEPEWHEKDAYTHLVQLVMDANTDWGSWDGESYPVPNIRVLTPTHIFKHADELLERMSDET